MAHSYFSKEEEQQLVDAIKQAEKNTSGEVRVHIESKCKEAVLDRAAGVFDMLALQETKLRNGVLFYLAIKDRKFAILGDAGINEKVGQDFWVEIKDKMTEKFKTGNFTDGLIQGILMTGEKLKEHFPYQKDDKNELSDEISFGS